MEESSGISMGFGFRGFWVWIMVLVLVFTFMNIEYFLIMIYVVGKLIGLDG